MDSFAFLVFWVIALLVSATPNAERRALDQMYECLGGPSWLSRDGWDDRSDSTCYCERYGVQCQEGCDAGLCDCPVVSIDLSFNGLAGDLSTVEYSALDSLTALNLAGNALYGLDVGELPDSLGLLNMSSNNVTDLRVQGTFPNLKVLSLENNQITEIDLDRLVDPDRFPVLEVLDLSGNPIEKVLPPVRLPTLRRLSVSNCRLLGVQDVSATALTIETIDLSHNNLGSVVPTNYAGHSHLLHLDLSYCSLDIDNLVLPSSLRSLRLSGNAALGNISLDFESTPGLVSLSLASCGLSEVADSLWNLADLRYLDLSDNRLDRLPGFALNMPNLATLNLCCNRLNDVEHLNKILRDLSVSVLNFAGNDVPGPLSAVDWGSNPGISKVDLSHNLFTGKFSSGSLLVLQNLQRLSLSNNKLSSLSVEGNVSAPITFFDVSNNTLNSKFSELVEFLDSICHGTLEELVVSGCGIHGLVESTSFSEFPSLSTVDLSWNPSLRGTLPTFEDNPLMMEINFQGTNVSGDVPITYETLGQLQRVDLTGTAVLSALGDRLPSFLTFNTNKWETTPHDPNMLCPSIFGRANPFRLVVDPSYYSYSTCICQNGFLRPLNGDKCLPCPQSCSCRQGTVTNCYPYPSVENFHDLVACPVGRKGRNLCLLNVPGMEDPTRNSFSCYENQKGQLCSECPAGYFSSSSMCVKCEDRMPALVLVSMVVGVLFLIVILLFLPSSSMVVARIIGGVAQALSSLANSNTTKSLDRSSKAVSFFITVANFDLNILQCLDSERWNYYTIFYFKLSIPLILGAITVLVYYVGRTIGRHELKSTFQERAKTILRTDTISQEDGSSKSFVETGKTILYTGGSAVFGQIDTFLKYWKYYSLYIYSWLINFGYFPLVDTILGNLGYSRQSDLLYLNVHPAIDCSKDNKAYMATRYVSFVAVFVFIIGIPLFFFIVVRIATNMRDEKKKEILLGFCTSMMKPKYKYWFLVTFLNRILISAFTSFVPYHSLTKYILLFLVLEGNLFLLHTYKPYKSPFHNIIFISGDYVVLITYVASVLLQVLPPETYPETREYIGATPALVQKISLTIFTISATYYKVIPIAKNVLRAIGCMNKEEAESKEGLDTLLGISLESDLENSEIFGLVSDSKEIEI